ncbi:MAG TPA: glycosyltransferase family 39 protein [Thermoanaerobaculia bacterium]|nr:glycosyltransferase family 39 protein [Thermoanaerobaculia bacterium]
MSETRWRVLLALIVVFTLARIAMTHRVFSQTVDEASHLIAGYDILTKRVYTTDIHHPPLARVLFALPFIGEPDPAVLEGDLSRGTVLLLRNDRYTQNVARARMPNLLFVAVAIIGLAYWARRLFTPGAGLLAALIFASLPPVLAHGGLATTDMALTATLIVALYVFTLVLEDATWRRTIALGLALAAGLLAKYSFLAYFPACALVLVVVRRRFPFTKIVWALVIALAIVWLAMPPQAFLAGLESVRAQTRHPPRGILFGEVREGGWWYYFPVALFFKTPIPFLILAIAGLRRRLELALMAAAILAIAMTGNINIGVRHVLPIYAPLAIGAAAAIRVRWLNIALIAWLAIGSAFAHPDYLAWFNAFAGREPQRILNDSNLDWGQDALRLVRYARKEKIQSITTSLPWSAPLDRIGLPPRADLQILQPVHGWLAISELNIALGRAYSPEVRRWLDRLLADRPYRRVGKTIRLYSFDSLPVPRGPLPGHSRPGDT